MKNHTEGCAVVRTQRCTCDYLSQWDKNAPVKPGTLVIPDEMMADFDRSTVAPGTPEILSASEYKRRQKAPRSMCVGHDRIGWHYTDSISCEDWEKELDRIGADKKPTPKLQLPVVITTSMEDPAVIAEKIVKDNPQWFGELPPEGYQKREEGRTPGGEAAFDMWKNRALKAKLRADFWQTMAIITGVAAALQLGQDTGQALGWW